MFAIFMEVSILFQRETETERDRAANIYCRKREPERRETLRFKV